MEESDNVEIPELEPLIKSKTVLPGSANPSIVGVVSFVAAIVVVIEGVTGGAVSTVTRRGSEEIDEFPDASVAVTDNS